jgi:two-component system sensor histidine kinase/response regulator
LPFPIFTPLHGRPKILVVDDQPINVQLLKRKLEREGITVVAAYNGLEALDLVAKDKPDLILLDVMMPDMDGIEVCQRLQANEETPPHPGHLHHRAHLQGGQARGPRRRRGRLHHQADRPRRDARPRADAAPLRRDQPRDGIDLQRRLAESRRAATIGAVTQGIAHNLNNLLGVVIGYLDLIKAYYDKPEQVKKERRRTSRTPSSASSRSSSSSARSS